MLKMGHFTPKVERNQGRPLSWGPTGWDFGEGSTAAQLTEAQSRRGRGTELEELGGGWGSCVLGRASDTQLWCSEGCLGSQPCG